MDISRIEDPLLAKVASYYSSKLKEHGASPRGVDWKDLSSQDLRLDRLCEQFTWGEGDSLNDVGCGYGRLFDCLSQRGLDYVGYDVCAEMISAAKARLPEQTERFRSLTTLAEMREADFCVASGIFNVKMDVPEKAWRDYVWHSLETLYERSRKGFSFNLLSLASDPEKRRSDLFYEDAWSLAKHCQQRFSRRVIVDHGYPLYEFTLTVLRPTP